MYTAKCFVRCRMSITLRVENSEVVNQITYQGSAISIVSKFSSNSRIDKFQISWPYFNCIILTPFRIEHCLWHWSCSCTFNDVTRWCPPRVNTKKRRTDKFFTLNEYLQNMEIKWLTCPFGLWYDVSAETKGWYRCWKYKPILRSRTWGFTKICLNIEVPYGHRGIN